MYFLLILFFGSLLGIIFMIGRKLYVLKNVDLLYMEVIHRRSPFLEEWKHLTAENLKKHSYAGLVAAIRLYVKSTNLAKNKYQSAVAKIKKARGKNSTGESQEKREASGFLKKISEYKHKIRKIKRKIKEEENL